MCLSRASTRRAQSLLTDASTRKQGPFLKMKEASRSVILDQPHALGLGVLSEICIGDTGGVSLGDVFFDTQPCFPCHALFLDSSNALVLEATEDGTGEFRRIGIAKFLRTAEQRANEPLLNKGMIETSPDSLLAAIKSGMPMPPWGPITENIARTTITIV